MLDIEKAEDFIPPGPFHQGKGRARGFLFF